MDKKNLFNKGNKRCVLFNYFRKHKVSFDNFRDMKCIGKNGNCLKHLIRSNCKISKDKIIEMIKNHKSNQEIRDYILKNVF